MDENCHVDPIEKSATQRLLLSLYPGTQRPSPLGPYYPIASISQVIQCPISSVES